MHSTQTSGPGLLHAGAGTGLAIVQLGAVIPGFLPVLLLTLAFAAVVVAPLLAATLALAVLSAPPAAAWWLWRRRT